MKVFISQPMRNKTDEEILSERTQAIEYLKNEYGTNVEIIDSFFQSAPINERPLWLLGKSLELLSTAELAVFLHGWDSARGCRLEHDSCIEYGICYKEL